MADLGCAPVGVELAGLRRRFLETLRAMADSVWPTDILDPVPSGKDVDKTLLAVQSQASKQGFNNVWAEKARMSAKAAVLEQWKRGQRNLFGRFKHVSTVGEKPMEDGTPRLVNLPEEFSRSLTPEDVESLQAFADGMDFRQAMQMFRDLKDSDLDLSPVQATALRAVADVARRRYGIPRWDEAEAVVHLHLDYRCVRGGRKALEEVLLGLQQNLDARMSAALSLPLTSVSPRGTGLALPLNLIRPVIDLLQDSGSEGQKVCSLVLEVGPDTARSKMVVVRPPVAKPVAGHHVVVAEDFGFVNTSSLAVLRSKEPISEEAVAFALSEPGKKETKAYLETNVSGPEVELVETLQFDGRDFLGRIKAHADRIDGLRSEIDRVYNRMKRIRAEFNLVVEAGKGDIIPESCPAGAPKRAVRMHGRFFRLLGAVVRLKALRRGIYRKVDGLKKAWFGYVSSRKAELAERYGAAVVGEDLSIVAVPVDDPAYKGRTFNRMMNNGSKGQYIRRSDDKLKWRGVPSIRIPSFWTSSYDWRSGRVDKAQRRGEAFTAASDGRVWDADLHAAEAIGRWLFLKPKEDLKALAA